MKSPWTSLLQQVHGPNVYERKFPFRQLAVVAEWFSRRPCSFASPPFGGFAFSWCAGCWFRWLLVPCKVACRVRLELDRGNPAQVPGPWPCPANHCRHKLLTSTQLECYTEARPGTVVLEGLGHLTGGRGQADRPLGGGETGGMQVARCVGIATRVEGYRALSSHSSSCVSFSLPGISPSNNLGCLWHSRRVS
jgi:hypothetical protein